MAINRTGHGAKRIDNKIASITNKSTADIPLMQLLLEGDYRPFRFEPLKRNDAKVWLKYGHVRKDGIIISQFDTPVHPGESVEVNITRPFATLSHPRLKIMYEDEDIIIVNKGYGLLSVETNSRHKEESAFSILRDYVKRQHPDNKIFVVHRLDRDTSGLMMFTKNIETQEALRHNWNNFVLDRTYIAVLQGTLDAQSGYIKSNLMENSSYDVYTNSASREGKIAITHFRVLERGNFYTLAEFSLDTGRKNQIRVHAADMKHPIVGDRKYGAKSSPIHRLALHARTLSFAHPRTRKHMRFELPTPSKFIGLVRHS